MAPTSHRKCQYRGPTCTGLAHAGYDHCARCYYDHVKPALAAERKEMKRRRDIKRHQLSAGNRALISAVDLKEPQLLNHADIALPPPLPPARDLHDVIIDGLIEKEIDQMIANGQDPVDLLSDKILKMDLDRIPVLEIRPTATRKARPTEEPKRTDMPIEPYSVRSRGRGAPPLAPETEQEIVDAYAAGMPTKEISRAYSIGTTSLYRLVRDAGVPTRKEPQVPTPPVSTPPVSAPPPNGVVSGLTEWTVTYLVKKTETQTVAAKTWNDAAASFDGDDVEVISVTKVKKS